MFGALKDRVTTFNQRLTTHYAKLQCDKTFINFKCIFYNAKPNRGGAKMMGLTPLEQKVLEALKKEGRATAPMLAERVGTTPASVRTALVRLSKVGLVKRIARGVYEPTEEART